MSAKRRSVRSNKQPIGPPFNVQLAATRSLSHVNRSIA
jgi:hypothetical protein